MGSSHYLHVTFNVCNDENWQLFPLLINSRFLYGGNASTGEGQSTVFAASFVLISVGSAIITLNALLLGGTLYVSINDFLILLLIKRIPKVDTHFFSEVFFKV